MLKISFNQHWVNFYDTASLHGFCCVFGASFKDQRNSTFFHVTTVSPVGLPIPFHMMGPYLAWVTQLLCLFMRSESEAERQVPQSLTEKISFTLSIQCRPPLDTWDSLKVIRHDRKEQEQKQFSMKLHDCLILLSCILPSLNSQLSAAWCYT